MQGLADGYFVAPYTLGHYFATAKEPKPRLDQPEFKKASADMQDLTRKLLAVNGKRSVNSFHKELGAMMWEKCGMARNEKGLNGLLQQIPALREEFWKNVKVAGQNEELNQNLEHAGRVADFLEFAELLVLDALDRRESCGGHFRTEYQTDDGEAKRDDENFAYVSAWEYAGPGRAPILNKEPLTYEEVHLSTRSYK
jgi:succinate dehydrogenase / fumarate reductase flavoprotein subunit